MHAISEAFLETNTEIINASKLDSCLAGMGTTAVMALVNRDNLFIASLGDSRAYLLRDGLLRQYTIDHSMAQLLVSQGTISPAEARRHRWRHMLWQHLGYPKLMNGPEVTKVRLQPGDRVLLSTDGLTGVLSKAQLVAGICSQDSPENAARHLVQTAVRRGTNDDATCVVVFVDAARR